MKKRENQRVFGNFVKTFPRFEGTLFLRADGNAVPSPAYSVSVAIHRPEITGQREKWWEPPRLFLAAAPLITASIIGLNYK